jgi:predicted DNA binding protein
MTAHSSMRKLIGELKAHGIAPDIIRVTNITDGEKLTPRQRNIVEYVFASGFYEYPRRSNLQKLSKTLGISSSTLGEMIRRAERKIIASYLRQAPHIGETDT